MNSRYLASIVIPLLLVGCSKQPKTEAAAGPGTAQAAESTPPNAATAPGNPAPTDPAPADPSSPIVQATIPDAQTSATVTIPAKTRIRVRLAQSLDTRASRPGEHFEAVLDEPIMSGDRVLIPKGTAFQGRVIEARRSGRLTGRAYLGVTLNSFRLHGTRYAIATDADLRASSSHKQRNLAIIGGGTGSGAAIGAIAGGGVGAAVGAGAGAVAGTTGAFLTGKKNVRLPAETPLVFSLHSAVTVKG